MFNMAYHPQYSGKKLLEYRDNPFLSYNLEDNTISLMQSELMKIRHSSYFFGCCSDNRSLFLVNHIYCHTILNTVNLQKWNKMNANKVIDSKIRDLPYEFRIS